MHQKNSISTVTLADKMRAWYYNLMSLMFWRRIPYWLRGGLIGVCIVCVLLILCRFVADPLHSGDIFSVFCFWVLAPILSLPSSILYQLFPSLGYHASHQPTLWMSVEPLLLTYLPPLVTSFIIGALSVVRRKKKMAERQSREARTISAN